MLPLNLPSYPAKIQVRNGKNVIFDPLRKKYVALTPEEWVRQQLLHHMVEQLAYPSSLIGVEVAITVGEVKKRCDAVVYNQDLQPLMLIECKAETVPITQKTLDQALTYNRKLNVPYLILYNGPQTVFVHVPSQSASSSIPHYSTLTTEN